MRWRSATTIPSPCLRLGRQYGFRRRCRAAASRPDARLRDGYRSSAATSRIEEDAGVCEGRYRVASRLLLRITSKSCRARRISATNRSEHRHGSEGGDSRLTDSERVPIVPRLPPGAVGRDRSAYIPCFELSNRCDVLPDGSGCPSGHAGLCG
jgi:hypothetical protein